MAEGTCRKSTPWENVLVIAAAWLAFLQKGGLMDAKAIGLRVRTLRARKGLTMAALGEKVRLSQAQVSRLENGLAGWRSATLIRFAKALETEPACFLVESQDVEQADVAQELDRLGLVPSAGLTEALKDAGFLKFMARCARAMRAHKKNLVPLTVIRDHN